MNMSEHQIEFLALVHNYLLGIGHSKHKGQIHSTVGGINSVPLIDLLYVFYWDGLSMHACITRNSVSRLLGASGCAKKYTKITQRIAR